MTIYRNALIVIIALLIIASAVLSQSKNQKLDLRSLEGNWEGNGQFLVPVTGISMSVEGKANFRYNEKDGYLRTALTGEKYLFTYSDSGRLIHDVRTDSISWEVWDNFGKHAKYHGTVDGNTIRGSRNRKDDSYNVVIELITADSLDFKMTVVQPDGDVIDKASFSLWRVRD